MAEEKEEQTNEDEQVEKEEPSRPPKEKVKREDRDKGKVRPGSEEDQAAKEAAEAEAIQAKANQQRIQGHMSARERKGQVDNDKQ